MLRTVSFSDKRVADVVNSKFVAAWTNRGTGFVNTDFGTEKWIARSDYEAYPTKNICTFFLTPEGKVFYYVAGSYAPELFLKILETASTLRTALFDDQMKLKEKGMALAKVLHEGKVEAYDDLRTDAERLGWEAVVRPFKPGSYRGVPHVHGHSCADSLQDGYKYLSLLHLNLAQQTDLPAFDAVRYTYLYGNDFTEETADSRQVSRPELTNALKPVARRIRTKLAETPKSADLFGVLAPGKVVGH